MTSMYAQWAGASLPGMNTPVRVEGGGATQSLRRFYPAAGRLLTRRNIRGPWRPSGAAAGAGVFSVVWWTPRGNLFWAPLHDFEAADQLRLVDECRRLDEASGCHKASR